MRVEDQVRAYSPGAVALVGACIAAGVIGGAATVLLLWRGMWVAVETLRGPS